MIDAKTDTLVIYYAGIKSSKQKAYLNKIQRLQEYDRKTLSPALMLSKKLCFFVSFFTIHYYHLYVWLKFVFLSGPVLLIIIVFLTVLDTTP